MHASRDNDRLADPSSKTSLAIWQRSTLTRASPTLRSCGRWVVLTLDLTSINVLVNRRSPGCRIELERNIQYQRPAARLCRRSPRYSIPSPTAMVLNPGQNRSLLLIESHQPHINNYPSIWTAITVALVILFIRKLWNLQRAFQSIR